jgi:hypothetical protein
MTTTLERGEGSASRPGRSLPTGKTRYPLYRRLGGPQGRSGQVQKISPPPGFDPRTVQPVASRYKCMRESKNVEASQDGICRQYVRWNRRYLSILFVTSQRKVVFIHTLRRMYRKSVKLAD